jgi:hypothetical protein
MFKSGSFRNAVLVAVVAVLATASVWARQTTPARRAGGIISAVPGESLVCVRINSFDATLDAVNAYLKDVTPMDVKAAVLSKLTGMLGGDGQLRGVNKRGNIAIFVLPVQGDSAAPGPMGNMFIGALLPVGKYENFVSRNANVGEPDADGISTIAANGRPMGLAMRFRRFALVCPPHARGQLATVRKMMNQRKNSLAAGLDSGTRQQSANSPVWIYLNIKQGAQMIRPMLFGKLEQIKGELKKAKEKGEEMPMDPAAIISFYGGIFRTMLDGTENITLALAPSAEACRVTFGLKPVPETTMAAIVGEPVSGDFGNRLGYLENGAMFNLCTKIDPDSLKITYLGLIELLGNMMPDGLSEADIEQLQSLTKRGIDAMGDTLSISFKAGEETPPFAGKYVIEVRDQEAFEQVLEEELKLMEDGVFSDLYKGFGMEMGVDIDRDAGTYKGSKIGGAMVTFKMGEEDSPPAKMMAKIFGDGIKYRWAFAAGHCVYTIGPASDQMIRELIDKVKAGGPKETGSEIRTAMEAISDNQKADAVGTFNFVRYMQLVAGFIASAEGVEIPEIDVQTESNIAFAGRTTEAGNLKFQLVMPKEHLLETKSIFENVIPKIKEQERLKREKQKTQYN